jgi:multiple sugar transport system substrate-binding protein
VTRVRRAALAVLTAGLIAAAVAGCAPAPGTQAWPPPPGETTITILSGTDTSVSAGNVPASNGNPGMYAELADWWNRYEEPVTHITIRLDVIGGGATAAHGQMLAAAETGDPSYDIYNLDSEWVPEFAAAGYIRSLQGRLSAGGFLAKPLASGEDAAGRLYAAPFTTDVGLLYYRTDLGIGGQIAGLHTFEQVLKLAQAAIAGHAGPGLTEGYAGQFARYEGLTVNVLEIIRSYDPAAFASNGTIRDPEAVAGGLEALAGAIGQPGSVSPIPGTELNDQEAQSLSEFATGHAVFMRNWPIYYAQLSAERDPGVSYPASPTGYVADHFSVAPLPFPSVLGGQDLAISAASRDPAAALQVIEFLTSAPAEQCLFQVGGFPATRGGAYAKGTLPTAYGPVQGHPLCGGRAGDQITIAPVILRAISAAIPRPVTRYYTEFSTVIQDQVSAMLASGNASGVSGVVSALTAGLQAAASGRAPSAPAAP